jgi:hypothetical protein
MEVQEEAVVAQAGQELDYLPLEVLVQQAKVTQAATKQI